MAQKKRMKLLIEPLELPKVYPNEKAIKSCNETLESYTPQFWQNEYLFQSYLHNVKPDELIQRYNEISENMLFFTEKKRDVIPLRVFDSSWFWYKKEFQTRLEIYLRKMSGRISIAKVVTENNECYGIGMSNKIYKFGKKEHIENMLEFGKVRFTPAKNYSDGPEKDPRTDNELKKTRYIVNNNARIITKDGKSIPVIGDIRTEVKAPNYYVFCTSLDYNKYMLSKFNYDSCLVINDINEFQNRIHRKIPTNLSNWYFEGLQIQYYDPYCYPKNAFFESVLSKHFKFSYQREYRIFIDPLQYGEATGFLDLEIGNLEDICEIRYT